MRNKILVVERDITARDQLEASLQEIVEEGGELIFTKNPDEALAIMQKHHPLIVFLDSGLGENMDLRNLKGTHIILTYPQDATPAAGKEYLFKPFRSHQVLEKCRQYLGRELVPPIPPM